MQSDMAYPLLQDGQWSATEDDEICLQQIMQPMKIVYFSLKKKNCNHKKTNKQEIT